MSSLKKEMKRFKDAAHGIAVFFKEGEHAKFHLFASLLVLCAGIFFQVSKYEWMLLLFCIAIVLITEALNTAVELLGDMVHKEIHPKMRKIKDMAAGAVLIAAICAAIVGLIIFIPYILKL